MERGRGADCAAVPFLILSAFISVVDWWCCTMSVSTLRWIGVAGASFMGGAMAGNVAKNRYAHKVFAGTRCRSKREFTTRTSFLIANYFARRVLYAHTEQSSLTSGLVLNKAKE